MNADSRINIERTMKEVDDYIKQASINVNKKLAKFKKLFEKEFPSSDLQNIPAEVLTWALFQQVIALYANGNNIAVIVELHAILEKFSMRDLPKALSDDIDKRQIIAELIERKTLSDIGPYYERLGVWSKDDLEFANRITKIRNGIAHKNEKLISKVINSGKEIHYLDIWSITEKHDTSSYIIKTISLLAKISNHFVPDKIYTY